MYELIFITDPLTEKIDTETTIKIRDFIGALGGIIKKENVWEKKKLAYPIKKHLVGFYSILQFEIDQEKISELQKYLKLNGDILRFLIVNIDQEIAELAKPKVVRTKTAVPTRPSEPKGEKIKIEELDKKLEEILKE